jgi:hypothetical protein
MAALSPPGNNKKPLYGRPSASGLISAAAPVSWFTNSIF